MSPIFNMLRMNASYLYAELVQPVRCPNCGASTPADRIDDIAPFVWHVVRDDQPCIVPQGQAPASIARELSAPCTQCAALVTFLAPDDVRLVAQDVAPSAEVTPALTIQSG